MRPPAHPSPLSLHDALPICTGGRIVEAVDEDVDERSEPVASPGGCHDRIIPSLSRACLIEVAESAAVSALLAGLHTFRLASGSRREALMEECVSTKRGARAVV